METKSKYCIKITSLFTPENIEIYEDQIEIDTLILKLLENLALNYGIGNVHSLYSNSYKSIKITKPFIELNNASSLYHFRITSSENTRIAVALLKKGIIDSENKLLKDIQIIVVVTSPKGKPDIYLKIVKSLKEFLSNQKHIDSLFEQKNLVDIWNFFDQANIYLPEVLIASDIMEDIKVFLKESNNLKDAIDMFVQTGYLNIPVIDLEGNLVGEVTSQELMEVCLPRYILWMDDIDPIINFESFQNLLDNEENSWLAEIINHDCAVIQKDEPFMKAAILMTKKSSTHAYVLDDNKLIGIIPLRFFLDKILRE